jgi:hypothetical protein
MTDPKQHLSRPTPKQLGLLRRLADERQVSFPQPQSFGDADWEIKELLKLPRTSRSERHRETREIQDAMATRGGDAAAVRDDEVAGYGSTATWA